MTNEFLFTSKGKNDECYTYRYAVESLLEFLDLFLIKKFAPVEFDKQTLTSPSYSSATCSPCSTQVDTVASLRQRLIIWCPFDTEESEFVKVFREYGYNVVNSHIDYGQDFYNYEPENWDVIISNPPFTKKAWIFKRAISFGKPFCLLMTLTWLNDKASKLLFKNIGMQLLMFEDRMEFKNQSRATSINFSSAYFCRDFLPNQIEIRNFKDINQRSLF